MSYSRATHCTFLTHHGQQGRPGVYPGLLDCLTGNLRAVGRIPTSHAESEEAKACVYARRQQVRQTVRTRGLPGGGCGAGAELRLRISRDVGEDTNERGEALR